MKKIIFTVTNDLSHDQRMQRICNSLADRYNIVLTGRKLSKSKLLHEEKFSQIRLKCIINRGKLFYLEYNLRLFIYLMTHKFDGICAIDLDTILAAMLAAKLKGKLLVYDAHEYFTEVPEVVKRKVVKALWERVAKICIPNAAFCYTVGPRLASILSKRYKRPFEVIRNVPLLSVELKKISDEKYILYQGALNKGRGLEALIEAMQKIPIKLIIAGEGDLSKELRKLANIKGLEGRIEFKGWVNPPDLRQLTSGAFLGYNLLEKIGESYYYSLSNKFFDYIQSLVPSLSPPFPEYEEINSEFEVAVLTMPEPEKIANTINNLLKDNEKYERFVRNCEAARGKYNWQEEEKRLISLYEQYFN